METYYFALVMAAVMMFGLYAHAMWPEWMEKWQRSHPRNPRNPAHR